MAILKHRGLIFSAVFAAATAAGALAAQATTVPPGDLGGFSTNGAGTAGIAGQAFNITASTTANLTTSEDNIFLSNDQFSTTSPFSISL